jgi:hypothetical protein
VAYVIVYGAGSLLYAECLYALARSLQGGDARSSGEKLQIGAGEV